MSRVFVSILSLLLWASFSLVGRRPLLPSLSIIRASPSILTVRSSSTWNGNVLSSTRSLARYIVCLGPTRCIFASARVTISYQLCTGGRRLIAFSTVRSEERRVGKEGRSRGAPYH